MNYRDCYAAYLKAVGANRAPGTARDDALLPLSCVPVLAYDNAGYSYPVLVINGVLYLVGAPSGWKLADLLTHEGGFPNGIAIVFGDNWFCTNIDEVLSAITNHGAYGVKA